MKARRAEDLHHRTTMIASRLFYAPSPRRLVLPTAVASAFGGFLLVLPAFDVLLWALYAVLLFGLPALASTLLTKPLADALGGRTYLRRDALLSFLSLLVTLAVVLAAAALAPFVADLPLARVLFLAFAAPLWLRHVVLVATSQRRHLRSLPASGVQPLASYALAPLVLPVQAGDAIFALAALAIFALAAVAFAELARGPLRRAFAVDGLRIMRAFLDHMTEHGTEGVAEIESFFASFAVPATVRVGVIGFKRDGGFRAVVVVPSVHPGPFGYAASSDLPAKVAGRMDAVCPHILVPHGASTHDENLATSEDAMRIGDAARALLAASPSTGGSRLARARRGDATATAQLFGDTAFVTSSRAPRPTDDIDAATGHAVVRLGRELGVREVLFVDAHNSLRPGAGMATFGSRESRDILAACREALAAALAQRVEGIGVGYATRRGFCSPRMGLGAAGLQVLVVEADGQRVAYFLFDGNNMVEGLREEIRAMALDRVDDAEVLTTDNHVVNATLGGYNPVGKALDRRLLVEYAEEALGDALEDLAPAEVVAGTTTIPAMRLFGPGSAERLSASVNATIAILRPAAAATLALALVASLLALVLIP
jgi:putative membrane protein